MHSIFTFLTKQYVSIYFLRQITSHVLLETLITHDSNQSVPYMGHGHERVGGFVPPIMNHTIMILELPMNFGHLTVKTLMSSVICS